MGIKNLITDKRIYLDTNIFIYALEGYPEFISILTELFDLVDKGSFFAFTSELTLAESLVKPIMEKNGKLQDAYRKAIQTTYSLKVVPVKRNILIDAAGIRALYGNHIKLPDAIHLSTARHNQCRTFITNDKRLKPAPDINVILLDAFKE